MQNIKNKIEAIDWQKLAFQINEKGYALIPDFLSKTTCQDLISGYDNHDGFRKTVTMERYRFGLGEYKYYNYPLPPSVQIIRENIYPNLVPIANSWMKALKINKNFPDDLKALHAECRANNQTKSTALILKYGIGGFNTLHQDLYGDVYFPMQAAIILNEQGIDYTGGEFVITQQTPRAQSKAMVISPKRGDMLVFATNFRPMKGERGYYRVNMRHGVSEVHSGERHTLGIIFHDAVS